jgi:16S rRNA (adenine1518-N6/adenine1519-N6)-dimethyltransferase
VASPALIVGNLPYHSAGTMVPRIVEEGLPVPAMVFLLQADMVDRLVSSPGTKSFSALTVLIRTHYVVERAFSVPATVFYPRPRVASAVAVLRELPNRPDRETTATLSRLTRAAFGQRRKTLRNSLSDYSRAMEECGIDPALRPERLAPEDFLALARVVHRLSLPGS